MVEDLGIGETANVESSEDVRQTLLALPELLKKDYYKDVNVNEFSRKKQFEKLLPLLKS